MLGIIVIAAVVPESRNPRRARLDLTGVAISAVGMVAVTYGVIEAGDRGWSDIRPLATLVAGALVLAAFVHWERLVGRRREPLVDLSLFRSPDFTWGTILATMVSFAMFGLLFNTPQYFQAVLNADSLGTGLRLLPMVAGLVIGVQVANRLVVRRGPKVPVSIGFALIAVGLITGATTTLSTGYGFTAGWIAVFGIGLGMTMSTTTMAALGALAKERGGVGSALIMALRQLGSAIGVARLGSLANAGYRSHLQLRGLSPTQAAAAHQGVSSGVAVAGRDHSLLRSVRSAFIHGMDTTLWVCGGIGALGLLLALLFLTARRESIDQQGRPAPKVPSTS
ncbi:MFS transporter [Spirillospora sp. NPDC046719]